MPLPIDPRQAGYPPSAQGLVDRVNREEERQILDFSMGQPGELVATVKIPGLGRRDIKLTANDAKNFIQRPREEQGEIINRALNDRFRGVQESIRNYWGQMSPAQQLSSSGVPGVSDVAGLYSDYEMYRDDPDSRNLLNYGITALGALPGIPAASRVQGFMRRTPDVPGLQPNAMPGEGKIISERLPYRGKTPLVDEATNSYLSASMENLYGTDQLAKQAQKIRQYPNINTRVRNPDKIANLLKEHSVENLNFLYNRMDPAMREEAMLWYDGANDMVNRWSQQYGIPAEAGAATIAALSPQKDWFQNVYQAEKVIDIYKNHRDVPLNSDILSAARSRNLKPLDRQLLEAAAGKTLDEMDNYTQKAMFVRFFNEAYDDRTYNVLGPRGNPLGIQMNDAGTAPKKSGWGSLVEIQKALRAIDDPSLENITEVMGNAHKIRNFYNNIIMPSNPSSVTIDTHAVAAALMRPLSGSSTEVMHNLGGDIANSGPLGLKGTYPIYADAYREAASQQGVLPRQMQSVTWEAIRGLYDPVSKRNAGLQSGISGIMDNYRRGNLTQGQMQEDIFNAANGIRDPAWWNR